MPTSGAAWAQHPGHLPQWPDPAPPPCAAIAEGPERDACRAEADARVRNEDDASRRYHIWLADRLAEDGGARNLAIAAHLRAAALGGSLYDTDAAPAALDGDATLAAWVARATAEGRDDAVVLSLLNRRFGTRDDARRMAVLARWQDIEPDNLAPWRFQDEIANADADTLLARADRVDHVDLHYIATLRAIVAAFARHPPDDTLSKRIFVGDASNLRAYAGRVAGAIFVFPRFLPARKACTQDAALDSPGRREACLRYGQLQADRSDTAIEQLMGLVVLRANAEDDVSHARYSQRRRRLHWLLERWRSEDGAHAGALSDTLMERIETSPDENDEVLLYRRILENRGVSLIPPDGWMPRFL